MGHALMENRIGFVVEAQRRVRTRGPDQPPDLGEASGTAEREAALDMLNRHSPGSSRRVTLAADKDYDVASFIDRLRQMAVTPHIARNDTVTKIGKRPRSAIDRRTTRHPGYAASPRVRWRTEEALGWAKTIGCMVKTKLSGTARNAFKFTLTMAAYNLIRMPRLVAEG